MTVLFHYLVCSQAVEEIVKDGIIKYPEFDDVSDNDMLYLKRLWRF